VGFVTAVEICSLTIVKFFWRDRRERYRKKFGDSVQYERREDRRTENDYSKEYRFETWTNARVCARKPHSDTLLMQFVVFVFRLFSKDSAK